MTKRVTVQALEDILEQEISVLDHGFIRLIDYMGSDSSIVQAARVSYGAGTKQVSQDQALISYLMRHQHTTPFEMCEIKFHIKLPIFIARQWIRHRTASVNEYSARYSIMGKDFYLPQPDVLSAQSKQNNQGRAQEPLPLHQAEKVLALLMEDSTRCYEHYESMLGTGQDSPALARELARMNLTLNYYTEWYWKIDLHNLFHFLKLRADRHAQYEIRCYAEAMLGVVKRWVPMAYYAFEEHSLYAVKLSRSAMVVLRKILSGEQITQQTSGLSKREWDDLEVHIGYI